MTYEGTLRQNGRYHNCDIYDYWAEDCKCHNKEKKEESWPPKANVAVGGTDHQGALMLATCDVVHGPSQLVHLTEKVVPVVVPDGMWVLDTNASNHMTGTRSMLT